MKQISIFFFAALIFAGCAGCAGSDGDTTTSGYSYELLHDAPGETAKPGDYVFVWTNIRLVGDSSIFDSRANQTEPSPVNIPAEDEAARTTLAPVQDVLAFASIGDSIRLIYPVDSFETRPASIANEEFIYYDMQVDNIMSGEEYDQMMVEKQQAQQAEAQRLQAEADAISAQLETQLQQYKSGALDGEIERTESGLGVLMGETGAEGTRPNPGQKIKAHYYGVLVENGEMFDNSYRRGSTFDFNVGQGAVIQGWDEGFALLNQGATATLFIPAELGYGARGSGSIPPGAELVFHVKRVE